MPQISFLAILIPIIILGIIYATLILYYWLSWKSIPLFDAMEKPFTTRISVIIPARNEENNIETIIRALQQQHYPEALFEIIIIDDHSTDSTAAITAQFPGVRLIQLNGDGINSYKKKAIATGISASTGDLIVTTDADCVPAPDWLKTIASYKEQTNAVFVAAPVNILADKSILQTFQSLDFMILQGITGAVVTKHQLSMCNGANLAYDKKVFEEVNGFAGIDDIASGDDMLLMHKISKLYPDKVGYLQSRQAIVSTAPMKTWSSFFQQRIRWASKATRYEDKRIFWVLLLVYLVNLSFLVLFVAGLYDPFYWISLLIFWIVKTIVEFPLFLSLAVFFSKRLTISTVFLFQPLHIAYTIISGLFGQFGKYEWKGRKVH